MPKVLVLGAGGMLGHKLCQVLPRSGCEVVGTVRWPHDRSAGFPTVFDQVRLLTNIDVLEHDAPEAVIARVQPEWVVNCVGIVKQRHEAQDPFLSIAVNSLLPHRLARRCADQGARLIHISTDCVFAGTRGSYREADSSDARDLYGKSKHLGETTDAEPCAVTLRTSMIGRELAVPGHGLVEWFLSRQRSVPGFSRAIFSGLTTLELAHVIGRIIENGLHLKGLYHVAGRPINKYELLLLIREAYQVDIDVARDETFVCDRSLIMERFAAESCYEAPPWELMIDEMHADPTCYERWKGSSGVLAATC